MQAISSRLRGALFTAALLLVIGSPAWAQAIHLAPITVVETPDSEEPIVLPIGIDMPDGVAQGPATTTVYPNGVGSGDVSPTGAVVWTRASRPSLTALQISRDDRFTLADPFRLRLILNPDRPVRAQFLGLRPDTEYHYRAIDVLTRQQVSGRFTTSARADVQRGLRFGIAGDWQQAPPYPAISNVDERDLEVFVKLGDTIYADLETPAIPGVPQARTLDQFRTKHREVASPRPEAPDFNPMPEVTRAQGILATIDDHEIVDNFAGGAAPGDSPDAPLVNPEEAPLFTDPVSFVNETQAYIDALQAYQEHHPQRIESWSGTADVRVEGRPKLYRTNRYGLDATITMLDSRSFRDAQLPPVADPTDPVAIANFLISIYAPERTLLGRPQLEQLKADLLDAQLDGVTWKFVVIPEPIQNFGVVNAEDRFEGYAAERTELLAFIAQNGIKNVVFMAGDFHGTLVNNLTFQPTPLDAPIQTGAIEVVTGPVSFFDGRFGPAVVNIAAAAGLITPEELAFYNTLPIAPDTDDFLNDRDDFLETLINGQLSPLGLDPIGLDNNLPSAEGLIDATLISGDYVSAHNFAWSEFDIDAETQQLRVTVWGIEAHSEQDFLDDPLEVISRTPQIVTEFVVNPQP